jgi:exosortase/archaeosortase family protein
MKMNRHSIIYITKFLLLFSLLYYGTFFFIGITAKGGIYIEWLDKYFNYVRWLRNLLLYGSKLIVELLGYTATIKNAYNVQINNTNSVVLVYNCLGYGVISYWIAFIVTNNGSIKFKLIWLMAGIIGITLSNMIRIAVILIAVYSKWKLSFNIEHHAFYNILSYGIIILLSLTYLKQLKTKNS